MGQLSASRTDMPRILPNNISLDIVNYIDQPIMDDLMNNYTAPLETSGPLISGCVEETSCPLPRRGTMWCLQGLFLAIFTIYSFIWIRIDVLSTLQALHSEIFWV
mmetsp:Transcript_7124/g.14229  ORF Transcript_7124/g.14229 Transcript_7124/m.14229 type:complete len:105 (-) Transcript_7124:1039-1353(-)